METLHGAPLDETHRYVFSVHGPAVWDHAKGKSVRCWEDLAMPATAAPGTELDDYSAADVYTAVCQFSPHPDGRTEGQAIRDGALAASVPGLWADLDVKPDVPHMPRTREELDAVLTALPTPTMLTDSGSGGAHAYWLFTERQPVTEEITGLITAWTFHVNLTASTVLGRTIRFDAVGDLARVLRVPGSINQKNRAAVVLRHADGPRYTPEELRALIDPAAVQAAEDQRKNAKTGSRITATARTEMTPRQVRYAEVARDREIGDLADVGNEKNDRGNNRICSVAKRLAGFLYCGAWTVEEIYAWITATVNTWTDPDPTVEKTITSALRVYADATFPDDDPADVGSRIDQRVEELRIEREARRRLDEEEQAAARGPRPKRSARQFAAVPKPAQVIGSVLAAEVNLLGGPSAAGKSLLARDWALSVAAGQPWQGHPVPEPRNVLYVASEGTHDFADRWEPEPLWEDAADRIFVLDEPVSLVSAADTDWLINDYADDRPGLVIFDVIYGMGLPDDNGTKDVVPLINNMKRISAAMGAATLALGHPGHNGDRRFRGSSAWRQLAAVEWHLADARLTCEKSKIADARRLTMSYGVDFPRLTWVSNYDAGVTDQGREEVIRADIKRVPNDSQRQRADRLSTVMGISSERARKLIGKVVREDQRLTK